MGLFLGIVLLIIGLWLAHVFSKSDPQKLAKALKTGGGIAAVAFAVFLGARGQVGIATVVGTVGLGLLGWGPLASMWASRTRKSTGQVSRVRSAFLEMELDHDSGAMRGRVLQGRLAGVSLETLDVPALLGLIGEVDEESQALLAAYLDRRNPGWREHAQGDAGAGKGRAPSGGPMTEQEAYQILGLEAGASDADIRRAHRSLMKRLHPDQGGSTYLAARVNEAKDVLLRRHR
jgi:DnaJ domain